MSYDTNGSYAMLMAIWQQQGWRGKVYSSSADASGIGLIWPRPRQQATIWAGSTAPSVRSQNLPPHNNMHVSCIMCLVPIYSCSVEGSQYHININESMYNCCWFHRKAKVPMLQISSLQSMHMQHFENKLCATVNLSLSNLRV